MPNWISRLTGRTAAALLLSGLVSLASAQDGTPRLPQPGTTAFPCTHMSMPEVPAEFSGAVKYQARGTVVQGRVTSVEVAILESSKDFSRRLQRAVVANIVSALRAYQCEHDGIFEQRFAFDSKPQQQPISP